MYNVITQSFLFDYFFVELVTGKIVKDKDVFCALSKVWNVERHLLHDIYEKATSKKISTIQTERDYVRTKKSIAYAEMFEGSKFFDDQENTMLEIKRSAIALAESYQLIVDENYKKDQLLAFLQEKANEGNVAVMRLLGILFCDKKLLGNNQTLGTQLLQEAFNKGDLSSGLALLYYGEDSKEEIYLKIEENLKHTIYAPSLSRLKSRYFIERKSAGKIKLVDKSKLTKKELDRLLRKKNSEYLYGLRDFIDKNEEGDDSGEYSKRYFHALTRKYMVSPEQIITDDVELLSNYIYQYIVEKCPVTKRGIMKEFCVKKELLEDALQLLFDAESITLKNFQYYPVDLAGTEEDDILDEIIRELEEEGIIDDLDFDFIDDENEDDE